MFVNHENKRSLMKSLRSFIFLATALFSTIVFGQGNGKLQMHFVDVGQGDSTLLISPNGTTVLVDDGPAEGTDRLIAYMQQLGLTGLDYLVISHYHDDHIAGTVKVLQEFPLKYAAYDRGESNSTPNYKKYIATVGTKRTAAIEGSSLVLDQSSQNPVKIEFAALNGNGKPTRNENDRSLVCVVRYGQFDTVLGGDLSGKDTSEYRDIESSAAKTVGQVEVYKVHHHGSKYSSNTNWISTIHPRIGIISCGDGNKFRHPNQEALNRLHNENITTYWTENGNGVSPVSGLDKVGGNILIESAPAATTFTVTYNWTNTDTYSVWNPLTNFNAGSGHFYAWSKQSSIYHFDNCKFVKNINPSNLETNTVPPSGKTIHLGCPK
jgi:beta-lactamase superfamily II metal-dependent hydrolase